MTQQAFKEIFSRLYPKVHAFALRACGQRYLADDIADTVFLKLWTHRDSIAQDADPQRSFSMVSSYVFMITRNTVNDYFRERAQIERYRQSFAREISEQTYVEERIDARKCLEIVDRVVNEMPVSRRKVFVMSRYQGLDNTSIANLLQISKRTVEKHISDSLSQIRLELASYQV